MAAIAPAQTAKRGRFFFSGDGELEMRHAHLQESLRVRYRDADGRYDPAALAEIERFFRSRTDGQQGSVSLRLIELIDYVQDRSHATALILVSAYRSPEFNQSLRSDGRRVAQASLHTEGLAADIAFAGVDLRRLWMQLRQLRIGGVGLYKTEGFLHLDTGSARFWEPSTSGVEKNLSADNARVFARTDFDRYDDLEGAVVRLHGITALPIRVHRQARLGERAVSLVPKNPMVLESDCYVLQSHDGPQEFIVDGAVQPPEHPEPLRLRTCTPRLGATPAEIVTNPIESW